MRFQSWSLWVCGALAAIETWILFMAWAGFQVLPKGGTVDPITYVYLCLPLLLAGAVLTIGRR